MENLAATLVRKSFKSEYQIIELIGEGTQSKVFTIRRLDDSKLWQLNLYQKLRKTLISALSCKA